MNRLDNSLFQNKFTQSRSQAENYIKLGLVKVNNKVVKKPSFMVTEADKLEIISEQYVSRAALKLASIAKQFNIDFRDKVVLDIGSSTGGFTDFALRNGAKKVIAVDVGTDQLHPSLIGHDRIELHEKTDIRDVRLVPQVEGLDNTTFIQQPDIILIDVSFISLKTVLPAISKLMTIESRLIAMCKPQFEAGRDQLNKGVIKNSAKRRSILRDFEAWLVANKFSILDKADSQVAGSKGNVERFYKLRVK